jgi:hypothetical protein
MPSPRLLSVNVGLPRDHSWRGRTVRTGVWKESVTGRQGWLRLLGQKFFRDKWICLSG